MFRTIMVPLDGTPHSEMALPTARAIAKRTGGTLQLVRIHPPPLMIEAFDATADLRVRSNERLKLERLAAELIDEGVPAVAAVFAGPVVETLEWYAEAVGADLVVMSTHGRGPLARAFLGGVADELVRKLQPPTLLVHPPRAVGGALRHMLVALDGTPESESLLPSAMELGLALATKFTLARVVSPITDFVMLPVGVATGATDEAGTEALRASAASYLERLAGPMRDKGLDVTVRAIVHTDPAGALADLARKEGCDLLALESHGRAGLARFISGSVVDDLVRRGETLVLTHAGGH